MTCPACNATFETAGSRDRFCSDACKMRAYRARKKPVCKSSEGCWRTGCACQTAQDERMFWAAVKAAGPCPCGDVNCISCPKRVEARLAKEKAERERR